MLTGFAEGFVFGMLVPFCAGLGRTQYIVGLGIFALTLITAAALQATVAIMMILGFLVGLPVGYILRSIKIRIKVNII